MLWSLAGILGASALLVFYAWLGNSPSSRGLRSRLPVTLGLVLTLGSIFLPWIRHGGSATFGRHMDQLARALRLGDLAGWAPRLPRFLGVLASDLDSGDTLVRALSATKYGPVCTALRRGHGVLGWGVGQCARSTSRTLGVLTVGLTVAAALLLGVNLAVAFARNRDLGSMVNTVTAAVTGLLLAGMLWYLPTIDTFGNREDLPLRVLTIAGEARVAEGFWLTMVGLVMVIVSAVLGSVAGRRPRKPSQQKPNPAHGSNRSQRHRDTFLKRLWN